MLMVVTHHHLLALVASYVGTLALGVGAGGYLAYKYAQKAIAAAKSVAQAANTVVSDVKKV